MRGLVIVFALFFASPAFADGAAAARLWVQVLESEGYSDIEIERTWLGRYRIEGERDGIEREIVLDRSTGEVLRDVSRAEDGEFHHPFEDLFDGPDDDD